MLTSKRALQMAVAIGGLIPVCAGLAGIIMGLSLVPGMDDFPISLDSHFRYLSGLLLGIGLTAWSFIPKIETKGTIVRTITAIVFIGGLGRLYSLFVIGVPDIHMLLALVMELVITPLLAFWQYKVEKQSRI